MKNDLLPRNEWWKIRFLNAALDLARSYTCLKAFALRFLGTQVWEEFNLVFDVFVLVFVKGGKKSFSILVNLNTEIFFRKIWELIIHTCVELYFRRVCGTNPGKMVPGKMVPGKMVPGKLVPGKMIPGKLVPGKLRNEKSRGGRRASWCVCVECDQSMKTQNSRTNPKLGKKPETRKQKIVGWTSSIVVCVWNVRMWSIYENPELDNKHKTRKKAKTGNQKSWGERWASSYVCGMFGCDQSMKTVWYICRIVA